MVILEKTIERLEDNKVKFDVTIEADEVDKAIDDVYREVNRSARIPGFRKGKAPRKVLQSNFGAEYFKSMATANLIESISPEIVDGAGFIPLRDYDYGEDLATVEEGQDFTYSFTILVKPEMELSSIEPVSIKLARPVATDADIDAQIDLLRSYYIDLQQVSDRPVKDDDIVAYSQECLINGDPIEEGKEDRRTHVVGSPSSSKEFDEQLIGMSIGETKDIVRPSSELGLDEKYPLIPITARVTILEITEKAMPELTDEWCQQVADCENIEALRKQVGASIATEKENRVERNKNIECLDELSSRLQGDIPEEVLQDCQAQVIRSLFSNLQEQGYTLDQYLMATGQDPQAFSAEMEEQGKQLAKQDMALDALARGLELEVTEEDIAAAFADAEVEDPAAVREQWETEHRMATLHEQILRDKAAKWLYANAEVEFVSEEEYQKLHHSETASDEAEEAVEEVAEEAAAEVVEEVAEAAEEAAEE